MRYAREFIPQALSEAAAAAGAFNCQQLVTALSANACVVKGVGDDGKLTGECEILR
jgi:hypothetical protein